MSTIRRLSMLALIFGWIDHTFSLFAIPFIDILEPAKVDALTFYGISERLSNFVELTRELNMISYNADIYLFRPIAEVLNIFILGMVGIAVVGFVFPRARVIKAVAVYNLIVVMAVTLVMLRVNDFYGIRMFANPANNVFYIGGLMFTFGASFACRTVINEDVKKEGYIL